MAAFFGSIIGFIAIGIAVVLIVIVFIVTRSRWKIAKADQALVITGGSKGMQIHKGGGAFVSPFRKHQFFPLGVMTVESFNQETQTSTMIPIVVKWTAQVRPDTDSEGGLEKAIIGFSGMDGKDDHMSNSLTQTLDGEVRAIIATMTPEEVVAKKDDFGAKVKSGVSEQMENLGFTLVSLNIAEVSDSNGYYKNLAAKDREAQRQSAETLTAVANREVAVAQAAANQVSESATLDKDLAVAAKSRDVAVQKAAFKAETDSAEKDAEFSGQLRNEDRRKDLATRQGEVKVIEEQQAQAAAVAHREVELTDADTARQTLQIQAEATAKKVEIDAGAASKKLEIDTSAAAKATKLEAEGKADAAIASAKGVADAQNLTTEATANNEREVGLAQAQVISAKGAAEAEALLAKGKSEAEAQRLMAEALAANDGANLQVRIAEINRDTQVTVYTEVGKAMAHVGEKATFIDMGGSSSSGGGSLLSNVLGDLPELMKKLDVKNSALNGGPVTGTLGDLVSGFLGRTSNSSSSDDDKDAAKDVVTAPTSETPVPKVVSAEASVPVVAPTPAQAEASGASTDAAVATVEAAASIVDSAREIVKDVTSVTGKKSARSGKNDKAGTEPVVGA